VAEQSWLDVVERKRAAQERIRFEVDLANGEVIRRQPVPVDQIELLVGERPGCDGRGSKLARFGDDRTRD
jgi:hypothetical protein